MRDRVIQEIQDEMTEESKRLLRIHKDICARCDIYIKGIQCLHFCKVGNCKYGMEHMILTQKEDLCVTE